MSPMDPHEPLELELREQIEQLTAEVTTLREAQQVDYSRAFDAGRSEAQRHIETLTAELTALRETNDALTAQFRSTGHVPWLDRMKELADKRDATVKECEVLREAQARLEKECLIRDLATPIEEDLSNRIDDLCKHLAMEDGYTLNGIARLLIETQKRMAADWLEIGRLRPQVNVLTRERDEARAENLQAIGVRLALEARAESAERQLAEAQQECKTAESACADLMTGYSDLEVRNAALQSHVINNRDRADEAERQIAAVLSYVKEFRRTDIVAQIVWEMLSNTPPALGRTGETPTALTPEDVIEQVARLHGDEVFITKGYAAHDDLVMWMNRMLESVPAPERARDEERTK